MIIGIDGEALTIKFPCGTKRYARELVNGLARNDRINTYIIFAPRVVTIPNQPNFILKVIPLLSVFPFRQIVLPWAVSREKADVFHYLHPYGSVFLKHPKIVTTIHDFRLEAVFPKNTYIKYFLQYMRNVITRRSVIKSSRILLCVSRFVKKESDAYLRKMNIPVKSRVIYEGVDTEVFKPGVHTKPLPYCLCMADFSPRKNIPNIIRAFAYISRRHPEIRLKIVVSTQFSRKIVRDSIAEIKGNSLGIDVLVSISQEELVTLYQRATCLIYPSLYEGFGLPILEAMACGCPVITSNRGSMKEVAADAAYTVNPGSHRAIAEAMSEIIKSPKLALNLREKGLRRTTGFTWDRTAQQTLAVYRSV